MTTTEHAFTTDSPVSRVRGLLGRRPSAKGRPFDRIRRCWLPAALTIFVAGCANRKPLAPDPFFGPTAVPPPATGCAQAPRNSYLAASEKVPAATVATPADRNNAATSTSVAAMPAPAVDRRENGAVSTSAIWQTGPTASGAIRTRVRPPDYASTAPSQPAAATDSAIASHGPTSATTLPGNGDGTTTVAPGEPIVCVIQPLASASREPAESDTPRAGAAEAISATPTSSLATSDAAFAERKATLASPPGLEAAGPVVPAAVWTTRSGDPSPASGAVPTAATAGTSAGASGQFPRRIVLPRQATDIMDLPDAPGRAGQRRWVDPRVRLASATAPAAGPQSYVWPARAAQGVNGGATQLAIQNRGSTIASTTPSLRYGYDPAYGWLRGRLEYSEVARRWKLRYIPIDGRVDQYGGSVVLGESTLLSGRQKGDFVEVRGRLLTGENGHWGYAPVYQVAQLQPVGR